NDVRQVWAMAEVIDAPATARNQVAPLLAREIRCAVAVASLHDVSRNIPPFLLTALVAAKLWTLEQALVAARQNTDATSRSKAIADLIPYAPDSQKLNLTEE